MQLISPKLHGLRVGRNSSTKGNQDALSRGRGNVYTRQVEPPNIHQRHPALTVINKEGGDNMSLGMRVVVTVHLLLARGLGEKPLVSGSKAGKEEAQWQPPAHTFLNIHPWAILGLCALEYFPGNMNPQILVGTITYISYNR